MNHIVILGNITGDIFFDYLNIKNESRPFLRLILMGKNGKNKGSTMVRGLRVTLYDDLARLYYPYLKKGSEIAVIGGVASRSYKGSIIHEVNASQLLLLRKIDWENGEAQRHKLGIDIPDGNNRTFLVGEVQDDIHFDWYPRRNDPNGGRYAFLRLFLKGEDRKTKGHQSFDHLRVAIRGSLAELAYPYLRIGSKIAVDGHFQTRKLGKKKTPTVEITAQHLVFVENINWKAGGKIEEVFASAKQEELINDLYADEDL